MSDTRPNEENRERWRSTKMAWRAWRIYDKGSGWLHHAGGLGAVKANVAMAAAVAATATAGAYGAIAIRDTYIAPKQPVETTAIAPAPAVLDEEVRSALADAKEVITVGTASQEGDASGELARAERRAKQAATLVALAVTPSTPISTLNLGQYREPRTKCETGGTSWQRPFIVVVVKSLEPGTNVGQALNDAMSGQQKLPPKAYSAFALTRYR
jgi:hypothetical protein